MICCLSNHSHSVYVNIEKAGMHIQITYGLFIMCTVCMLIKMVTVVHHLMWCPRVGARRRGTPGKTDKIHMAMSTPLDSDIALLSNSNPGELWHNFIPKLDMNFTPQWGFWCYFIFCTRMARIHPFTPSLPPWHHTDCWLVHLVQASLVSVTEDELWRFSFLHWFLAVSTAFHMGKPILVKSNSDVKSKLNIAKLIRASRLSG